MYRYHNAVRNRCGCAGKCGKPKNLYHTEADALEQVDYAKHTRGVTLNVYRCPSNSGYHLTSNQRQY